MGKSPDVFKKYMFNKIYSASIHGVNMFKVNVEVDISDGLPNFDMVGLLNSEVKESRERVRTAIKNQGILLPPKRITVNLSPANIRKGGNYFDLPIAVGILKCLGIIYLENLEDTIIVGELSLNGSVNKTNGILSVVHDSKKQGFKRCIVPFENAMEGGVIDGVEVYGVKTLGETIKLINENFTKSPVHTNILELSKTDEENDGVDFADVNGQESVKRAALVAACGMHHILLIGSPGSGKSMIASRISTILPQPDISECLEITKIHSIAGKLQDKSFIFKRPFRAPHHTITKQALIGGGASPKPGEMSLAHRGVLFLDELAEFKRDTIDVLRQPLEREKISISRASGMYQFPAKIMMVAATNPCKCGYYPDRSRCMCSQTQVNNYLGRISGPILDRIDICINTPILKLEDLSGKNTNLDSSYYREMVEKGREIQKYRYRRNDLYNSNLSTREIEKYCKMTPDAKKILDKGFEMFKMSGRAYYKITKVARTIADLAGEDIIQEVHMAEAVGYRLWR